MAEKSIYDQIFDLYIEGTLFLASSWLSDAIMVFEMAIDLAKKLKESDALSPYHPKYIPILLKLSKCHMKERSIERGLSLLDEALVIDPLNSRAILQKATYFSSVLNENEALNIINKGLENINKGAENINKNFHAANKFDPLYSTLIRERKRLSRDTKPLLPRVKRQCIKNTNLLKQLPVEVIVFIMKQLDQRSFINCLATCRDWRSTLLSIPELLGSFVLKRGLTLNMFNDYASYIKDVSPLNGIFIANLNIDCTRNDEKAIVKKLLASGLIIRNLKLSLNEINNFELVRMKQIACSKLFEKLVVLNLSLNLLTKGTKSIENIIEMCYNLKFLDLTIKNFNEKDNYTREPLSIQKKCISKLEHLKIFNTTELFLIRIFSHFEFPHLESLSLKESAFNKKLLYLILETPTALQNLDLVIRSDYPFLEFLRDINDYYKRDEVIKHFRVFKFCYQVYQHNVDLNDHYMEPMCMPRLKILELQKDRTPFNELMKYIQRCKSIETFALSEFSANQPTTFSLKLLLDKMPKLKNLKLITHTLRGEIINTLTRELIEMNNVKVLETLETNSRGVVEVLKKSRKIQAKNFITVIFHNNQQSLTDNEIRSAIFANLIQREIKRYDRHSSEMFLN